jgi:uracil-DNA glycosylase family 4
MGNTKMSLPHRSFRVKGTRQDLRRLPRDYSSIGYYMKDKKIILKDLYRLIDLASDYIRTGYRSEHSDAPDFSGFDKKLSGKTGPIQEKQNEAETTPIAGLEALNTKIKKCTLCRLHIGRKNAVPGEGVLNPKLMIVGEAPTEDDDRAGAPFVGAAGQYLSKWLEAIKIDRKTDCYVSNIVKCRPPQSRQPSEDESATCFPYLLEQIRIIKPRAILCVGLVSSRILTGKHLASMNQLRESAYEHYGTPLFVTYHPSAVLRDTTLRKPVWDDMQKLQGILERL